MTIPTTIAEAVATMTTPYLGAITAEEVQRRLSPVEPPEETPETLLTVHDVQRRLNVSLPTVHRMLNDGRLKKIKVGRAVRIPESSVNEYISKEEPKNGNNHRKTN